MNKVLFPLVALLTVTVSYGQGQVVFGNLGGGVNAPVFDACVDRGPGPDYSAGLYLLGLNGSLTALAPTTTFRSAGTGAQAIADRYLTTKTVDVPGVAPGNPATFVIRVWQTRLGSYDAAVAAKFGYGMSASVTINVGGGQLPAANLTGLQGFTIGLTLGGVQCPEPSTIAVAALGASLLLLVRRK
jgi:hypothetical protein